jgi:hypothetical protein
MKKLFLVLSLTLSLSAYSQIVVKETAKDSTVWYSKLTGLPKLVHFYGSETDDYTLYYKNLSYQYITDINYISLGTKEGALEFFNILKQAGEDGKEITFDLDKKTWYVRSNANLVHIWSSGTQFFLTKKNIESILESLK